MKIDFSKFKYDWVQIIVNENVDLGNLSFSLTKANSDPPFFKKFKTDDEQQNGSSDNEPFKLKVESTMELKPQPKHRKSALRFKVPEDLIKENGGIIGNNEVKKRMEGFSEIMKKKRLMEGFWEIMK